jgi:DNA-binding MarR family transcriptional regulator
MPPGALRVVPYNYLGARVGYLVVRHNSWTPDVNVDPSTPQRLHDLLMDFGRVAGLLHPDQTVPGQALSLSQAFALHELDAAAPLSQRDLAQRLRLEKSTVSRLVADLEDRGLLTRQRDPDNRRVYRLQITAEGRQTHAVMGSAFHDQFVRMTAALTGREQAALLVGLPALIRVLRQDQARDDPAASGRRSVGPQ